ESMFGSLRTVALLAASAIPLLAVDPDRDFSGKWIFDPNTSNTRPISAPVERLLTVVSDDVAVHCAITRPDGSTVHWKYLLDGSDTRYTIGDEKRNSEVKWEGRALLVSTIVTGPQSFTISDRWTISRD